MPHGKGADSAQCEAEGLAPQKGQLSHPMYRTGSKGWHPSRIGLLPLSVTLKGCPQMARFTKMLWEPVWHGRCERLLRWLASLAGLLPEEQHDGLGMARNDGRRD